MSADGLVDLAAARENTAVHFPVFTLLAGGQRDPGGVNRVVAEDREFGKHHANGFVGLDQLLDFAETAAAVAAVVVEELDDRDIAVRISGHRRVRRAIDVLGVLSDERLRLCCVLLGDFAFKRALHLEHDLGIFQQVVFDDALDRELLIGRERRVCRPGRLLQALSARRGRRRPSARTKARRG